MWRTRLRSFCLALSAGLAAGTPIQQVSAIDTEIYLANQAIAAQAIPNVLFVFDNSTSMTLLDGGTETRMQRLQEAFNILMDNVTNVNVGLAQYTLPGGPILFPVSYIDADAKAIEGTAIPDVTSRISSAADDAEEFLSGGAPFPNKTDSMQLELDTTAAFGTELFAIRAISGRNDDAFYSYSHTGTPIISDGDQRSRTREMTMTGTPGVQRIIGLRYQNLPADTAPVTSGFAVDPVHVQFARVEFEASDFGEGDLDLFILSHSVADSQTFNNFPDAEDFNELFSIFPSFCPLNRNFGDLLCRLFLSSSLAGVAWNDVIEVSPRQKFSTPNIAPIIQEVFDRGDWMGPSTVDSDGLNNDLSIMLFSQNIVSDDASAREIFTRDRGASVSPTLFLEYVRPGAPAGQQRVGLRFQDLRIPQGTQIESAVLEFVPREDSSDDMTLIISGERAANSAAFTGANGDLNSRTKTSATATWDVPSSETWTSGISVQTTNIRDVVQEIVDDPGWCGGQAMSLFLEAQDTSSGGFRPVYSFESDPGRVPVLRVRFADGQSYAGGEGCIQRDVIAQVSSTRDDARERTSDDVVELASPDVSLTGGVVGVRFQNLPIPSNATVLSSQLELRLTSNTFANGFTATVTADKVADATDFQSVNENLTSRPNGVSASGSFPASFTRSGSFAPTFDMSAVVQDVVSNTAWESGNSMVFLLSGSGTGQFNTFDSHPARGARLRAKVQYNIGDLGGGEVVAAKTVRDRLKEIIKDIVPFGNTPITDVLYEAAQYYRGGPVTYGKNRGIFPSLLRTSLRISHPATYTGGTVQGRVGNCSEDNLNSVDCVNEFISGSPQYISPITNSCHSNFIVFLSDGAANFNVSADDIQSLTGDSTCATTHTDGTAVSSAELCGAELMEFLATEDQSDTANGNNNVNTYTIGFNLDPTASNNGAAFMESLADVGEGDFVIASTAQELAESFSLILEEVLAQTTSFAAPSLSINAFNRLFHRDEVFFSLFEPRKSVAWSGNVKKFNLRSTCEGQGSSCEVGEVLDVQGSVAIGADQRISDDARSNWPEAATVNDGAEIKIGGAGEVLQMPIDDADPATLRRVLVYYGTAEPGTFADGSKPTLTEFVSSAGDGVLDNIPPITAVAGTPNEQALEATRQLLGWPTPSVSDILAIADLTARADAMNTLRAELDEHIRWIRGEDVDDEDNDPATLRRFSFRDPLHSSPIAVTYGVESGEDPIECEEELTDFSEECIVVKVFVGTNEGGLQMINGFDGKEEWVFFPIPMLALQRELRENAEAEHLYGMDGTPTVWIKDRSDQDGDGVADGGADGIIDPDIGDRVRVFIGQRRGGRLLVGLDVTPDDVVTDVEDSTSTTPEYLFRIVGGTGDFPNLGETWSRPRIVTVQKGVDASSAELKDVVMFAGGYEAATQDGGFGVGNTGNAIYAIDPISGEREFYVSGNTGVSPNPHGTNVDGIDVSQMQFPIPSDLALMDSDADGAVDRIYVGDAGGQMWRVDVDPSLDDGSSDGTVGGYDLTVGRLASVSFLKTIDDVTTATPAPTNQRKGFYPPDVVSVRTGANASAIGNFDLVTWVTGNRSTPLSLNVQDRYYAFADPDIIRMPDANDDGIADDMNPADESGTFQGPIDADSPDTAEAGNMFDVTNDNDPTLTGDTNKIDGSYYITFGEPGEKGLAAPIILAGKVFFTTYLPEAVLSSTTCSLAEGAGLLYGLDVLDGSSVFNWESPDGTTPGLGDRTLALGAGIPSAAVPVFQPEKVTLLIGGGGGATTVDPGITLPRTRTYWFEQR